MCVSLVDMKRACSVQNTKIHDHLDNEHSMIFLKAF